MLRTSSPNLALVSVSARRYLEQILRHRLPPTAISRQDLPDLVHRALELMVHKYAQFDPALGDLPTWLYHCCAQPALKEYLRGLHYRLVPLQTYRSLLLARSQADSLPQTTVLARHVASLSDQTVRQELDRIQHHSQRGQRYLSLRIIPSLPSLPTREEDSYQEDLRLALRQLPTPEQTVLQGIYFRGYSQREIAEQLNISAVRVHQLKNQALKRLRRQLGEDFWQTQS